MTNTRQTPPKTEVSLTLTEKPTLKTISRISGLAVPTVSRALNDAPDIGADTKKLIRKIADEIGYIPNRAGVRLRTGRTNVISLVMSTELDLMSHTARLISSIAGGLRNTPYHLIVTPFFPDQDPMVPVKYIVETGSADAVIMNQIKPEDPRVDYLLERNFPFATHGRTANPERHPYYDYDNEAFGRLAVERMVSRGRRHLILVAPPREHAYAQHMIAGTSAVAKAHGIRLDVTDIVTSDSASANVVEYIYETISQNPTIDGIIVASTSSAMAAVSAIEQHNLALGQHIDLFAKEAVPFLKLFRADILTVAEKVGTAGEFLAKAAIQAIREPAGPPMQGLEIPSDETP